MTPFHLRQRRHVCLLHKKNSLFVWGSTTTPLLGRPLQQTTRLNQYCATKATTYFPRTVTLHSWDWKPRSSFLPLSTQSPFLNQQVRHSIHLKHHKRPVKKRRNDTLFCNFLILTCGVAYMCIIWQFPFSAILILHPASADNLTNASITCHICWMTSWDPPIKIWWIIWRFINHESKIHHKIWLFKEIRINFLKKGRIVICHLNLTRSSRFINTLYIIMVFWHLGLLASVCHRLS